MRLRFYPPPPIPTSPRASEDRPDGFQIRDTLLQYKNLFCTLSFAKTL